MNQGKLEVVKQEMARVNITILGISELKWTGSKLGKEYIKAVYCHPDYLTYMQSTSCKMPG